MMSDGKPGSAVTTASGSMRRTSAANTARLRRASARMRSRRLRRSSISVVVAGIHVLSAWQPGWSRSGAPGQPVKNRPEDARFKFVPDMPIAVMSRHPAGHRGSRSMTWSPRYGRLRLTRPAIGLHMMARLTVELAIRRAGRRRRSGGNRVVQPQRDRCPRPRPAIVAWLGGRCGRGGQGAQDAARPAGGQAARAQGSTVPERVWNLVND